MEFQLLVILLVALIVFGPEKMLQFATELGKWIRKAKQEWAQIQMELEMQDLKKRWEKDAKEGEEKVKQYLFGDGGKKAAGDKQTSPTPEGDAKPSQLSMEDLVSGKAPVVGDETEKNQKGS